MEERQLSPPEWRIITVYRKLQAQAKEWTLTIRGQQRSGRPILSLEPSYKEILTQGLPLSLED